MITLQMTPPSEWELNVLRGAGTIHQPRRLPDGYDWHTWHLPGGGPVIGYCPGLAVPWFVSWIDDHTDEQRFAWTVDVYTAMYLHPLVG